MATKLTHEMESLLDECLASLNFPVRTVNQLEAHGIFTVRELLETSRETILEIPNIGEKTLEDSLAVLAKHGFVRYDTAKSVKSRTKTRTNAKRKCS